MGNPIEEQRLADRHFDRLRPIWLDDQKRRFRTFPGQQLLGIGGDEHHRDLAEPEYVVHRLQSRAAVGKTDIRQHQP
jgi:hypothetical protein